MEESKTIEGNKLIAEFMGYIYFPDASINGTKGVLKKEGMMSILLDHTKPFSVKYHLSWEELMPVVEKIAQIPAAIKIHSRVRTGRYLGFRARIKVYGKYVQYEDDSPLKATWLAIVDFLKWYNDKKS